MSPPARLALAALSSLLLAAAAPLDLAPRVYVTDEVVLTRVITVTAHGFPPASTATSSAPAVHVPPAPPSPPAAASPFHAPAPPAQSHAVAPPVAPHPTTHAAAPPVQPTTHALPPPPVSSAAANQAPAPAPAPQASHAPAATSSGADTCPTFSGMSNPLPGASESYCCLEDAPCGTPQAAGAEASYYSMAGGTGACGSSLPDSASFVAVNAAVMGSLSSGDPANPLCGKTVVVKNMQTGQTASGIVADKCPGCHTTWGIDLSPAVFQQLAPESQGVFPVQWWFTDL